MRRTFINSLSLFILLTLITYNSTTIVNASNLFAITEEVSYNKEDRFNNHYKYLGMEEQLSKERVSELIVMNLLFPYMVKSVTDYYGGFVPFQLNYPTTKLLEADWKTDLPRAYFVVKIQIHPFLGAHYSVGIDNFTFRIDMDNKITLEKFEHIKSFKIPDYVKKQHLELKLE
ncbi:DUF3888 domain-containing protein [Clostridium scatologenes]|uniref:DUF3888 domain-containing protein n=1 Tax=Clostridium scatologenes TaxID=1548 RepID=A0A0E3GSG7_CLOSL|nr:DUF3888 domain-containing protein [Clostridium scatologenes]AKA72041.1 hypothetical protein CSCA_4916 [Clostridium scatologenes]